MSEQIKNSAWFPPTGKYFICCVNANVDHTCKGKQYDYENVLNESTERENAMGNPAVIEKPSVPNCLEEKGKAEGNNSVLLLRPIRTDM